MTTSRKTKQREAILNNLLSRFDHPTAEDVYTSIKEVIPSISLATVYRNLNSLADEGLIKTVIQKEVVHYDAHTEGHAHIICKSCGKITDFKIDCHDAIIFRANEAYDGSVSDCNILFYGLCNDCKQKI